MSNQQQKTIASQELPYWLAINRCTRIGPRRFALLAQDGCLSNYFNGTKPNADLVDWCTKQGIENFSPDWAGVEKDLAWAQSDHCHILTLHDALYPSQLKQIHGAPPVLFVQGQLQSLQKTQMAIVGSRHPTRHGLDNAFRFAKELVEHGYAITSGLAMGIDGASHEGALSQQGITLAVLGSSLDKIYPPKHLTLAQRIIEQGLLVSEFPIGTPPQSENFPRRNRIISGLSVGVLVVESTLKSGSLITASYALDQGREIFAIPSSIHNPLAKGCHQLIRQGAKCVEHVNHILEELVSDMEHISNQPTLSTHSLPKEKLSSISTQLLMEIDEICTPIDLMVDKTGLTAKEVCSMLVELELQGKVTQVPGGYIRIETGIKL